MTAVSDGIIGSTAGLNPEQEAQVRAYIDLLDHDSRPVPDVYRWTNPMQGVALTVPVERYTSRAFHDLEVEKVWKHVWQMACRVEDILEPGQYVKYDIAGISVLVVRQRDGSIKAHRNVCLHRGRTLKEYDGRADRVILMGRAELRRYRGTVLNDEMSGQWISYDNLTDKFRVDGQPAGEPAKAPSAGAPASRVRAVLTPRSAAGDAK